MNRTAAQPLTIPGTPSGSVAMSSGDTYAGTLLLQRDALLHLFDQQRGSLLLVDEDAHIIFASQRAQQLLASETGLQTIAGRLVAQRHAETVALHTFIKTALQPAWPHKPSFYCLRVSPSDIYAFMVIHVLPVESDQPKQRWSLLLIDQAQEKLRVNKEILRQIYGLTQAETDVVALLSAGRSLEQAAKALFVSVNTVRTHMRHIFLKTDTCRQSEIILKSLLCGALSR